MLFFLFLWWDDTRCRCVFFFQAEDGIRDGRVTGVQTCALPICERDLWTAKQQKRWYEEQCGEIEAVAIRCRACRRKEKSRRELARNVHLDGLARKRAKRAEQGGST